jgi:hypothetical protein
MNREQILLRRVRLLTGFFIFGLILSGLTAIPLQWQLDLLADVTGLANTPVTDAPATPGAWLVTVRAAVGEVNARYPFLFYGTDWLAFGHFVIAIAFVGALRDPVRNNWLFTFGIIACVLVVPYALVFGAFRGIPIWWRLMDCSFGVIGFVPLWFCRRWTREMELSRRQRT